MVARREEPEKKPDEARWTWEDFAGLQDEDDLRELVDGRLIQIDMPTEEHEYAIMALGHFLFAWAATAGGRVLGSGYKVKVSRRRGAMPDLQYYRKGRKPPSQALETGGPDLAIEVVSPTSGRYDRITKLAWYASIGVPEYWIVDPFEKWLLRYTLDGATYRATASLEDDAVFTPEDAFPGLVIPLAKLWSPAEAEPEPAPVDDQGAGNDGK